VKNFHKESSGITTRSSDRKLCRGRRRVMSWVCPWWDQTLAPGTPGICRGAAGPRAGVRSPMYTVGSRRKTGSILAPPFELVRKRTVRATASNLDTHLDRGIGRKVRMLLSFQRPSHLFRKVILLRGAPGSLNSAPGRTDEYSAPLRCRHADNLAHVERTRTATRSIRPGHRSCVLVLRRARTVAAERGRSSTHMLTDLLRSRAGPAHRSPRCSEPAASTL
jgi:hypothetical protein